MADNRIRNSYMYGSAAPEYPSHAPEKAGSAATGYPSQVPEKTDRSRKQYRAEARMKIEEKVGSKRKTRHELSAPYILILISAALILISAASLFLVEKCVNTDLKRSIASLQNSYQTEFQNNILKENMIERQTDYTEVYRYATEVLHMTVPTGHQIVGYTNTAGEYVVKNGSIPNE